MKTNRVINVLHFKKCLSVTPFNKVLSTYVDIYQVNSNMFLQLVLSANLFGYVCVNLA